MVVIEQFKRLSPQYLRSRFFARVVAAFEWLEKRRERHHPKCLNHFARDVYSCRGEDGILEHIFHCIGIEKKFFLEVGHAGLSRYWINEQLWSGIIVDRDARCVALARQAYESEKITCLHTAYSPDALNSSLRAANIPKRVDLLILYIEGAELHVWEALEATQPRVVCVLYNASYLPWIRYETPPAQTETVWDGSRRFSASLTSLNTVANRKGYSLVGCDQMGICAFFIQNDLLADHFEAPGNVLFHYRCPKYRYGHFGHLKKFSPRSNYARYKKHTGAPPILREGSFDRGIWDQTSEEYSTIPPRFTNEDVVLDIGAHIGSFSAMAALNGAGKVLAFEANEENFQIAKQNLSCFEACTVRNLAVWRSDFNNLPTLTFSPSAHGANTGGGHVLSGDSLADPVRPSHRGTPRGNGRVKPIEPDKYLERHEVESCSLDAVLQDLEHVRYLKIDAEGSEFPILYTSKLLSKVFEIGGEYHELTLEQYARLSPAARVGIAPYSMNHLAQVLSAHGFWVIWRQTVPPLGFFFASQEADLARRRKKRLAFGAVDHSLGL